MRSLMPLSGDVLRTLRDHLRPLIAYHLFFTLLASSLLLPAAGWTLAWMIGHLGRPLISNTGLLAALFAPEGLAWLLAAIGLTFLVLYLQQAGMTLVAVRPRTNHYRQAFETLLACLRRLPGLAGLVVLQVGAHLLLVLPVVLALTGLYGHFIGGLDPYYVLQARPPAFWWLLASALPIVLVWMVIAATLYARWHLALPILVLEDIAPHRALGRSARLTRGQSRHIVGAILLLLLAILVSPFIATALFDALFTPLLGHLPERQAVLLPAMLGYVGAYMLITLAITFLGIALNALLATCLYLRLAHQESRPASRADTGHPGRLAWAVEIAVVAFALSQAWLILNRFEIHEDVEIVAHRGSSAKAPENTIPAIDEAMADGADTIEIDVRLTRDGKVVLHHDSSLSRLAGDDRLIDELDSSELETVDVGSWFGDPFVDTRIAGLDEVLEHVRGRARLMIELKPTARRGSELVGAVEQVLENERQARLSCRHQAEKPSLCGPADPWQAVSIAALSYALLSEVEQRLPEAHTTLLAQLVMHGTLPRDGFDTLALRHNRITFEEVQRARHHGYRLLAWTVNDPARMSRLIDLGVDGIITDRPDILASLLDERNKMSDGALMLVKLRNWLRD
ncbi:glycerophosphoryl diester phosphodiesterase [Halomonas elongata]|uniref:Glycerophosphoryl diester phosphodiesterase n=1 Tax=Halomonas elongata TaxID=2746 RepID=A0A1B8P2T0_HALEL|nr:glycerophosphodiester phosphodiesterase family protein [Halomonas elongata]OBX36586.1 glycerophosphoryl diester phosphodiesterase [Halomonas elongata]